MVQEKNAEKSRQRILQAAESQFAAKGFYGARVDEIAAQADINKRMIYEYFTNKETLYKNVLFAVYKRMEAAEQTLLARHCTGVDLVREIICVYFDFLQNNPAFVSILLWENLNQARYLAELPASDVERPTIRRFAEELRRGKEAGVFRREIDEKQTVVSLIMVCFANFSNRYTLSKLFGLDLSSAQVLEERKQHTIDMVLAYLLP